MMATSKCPECGRFGEVNGVLIDLHARRITSFECPDCGIEWVDRGSVMQGTSDRYRLH